MERQLRMFGLPAVTPEEAKAESRRNKAIVAGDLPCGTVPVAEKASTSEGLSSGVRQNMLKVMAAMKQYNEPSDSVSQVYTLDQVKSCLSKEIAVPQVSEASQAMFFAADPGIQVTSFVDLQPFCQQVLQYCQGDAQSAMHLVGDADRMLEALQKGCLSYELMNKAFERGFFREMLKADWSIEAYDRHLTALANGLMKQWKALKPYWEAHGILIQRSWSRMEFVPQRKKKRQRSYRTDIVETPQLLFAKRDFVGKVIDYWNRGLLKPEFLLALPAPLVKKIVKGMKGRNQLQAAKAVEDWKSKAYKE